jgi:hypothetical protein
VRGNLPRANNSENVAKLREPIAVVLQMVLKHGGCSSRISSAMLVRDSRTSSANGAFGRPN